MLPVGAFPPVPNLKRGLTRQSARAEHFVPRYRIAERGSKKYVGWEMCARGYAREAYRRGETVHRPWHPAVVVISAGDDRCYREHPSGVSGWKGTALKRRFTATEEGIPERPSWRNVTRPFPAGNSFDYQVDNSAVRICLPCQQCGTGLI